MENTTTPNLISAGKSVRRIGNLMILSIKWGAALIVITGIIFLQSDSYVGRSFLRHGGLDFVYFLSFCFGVIQIIILVKIITNIFKVGNNLMGDNNLDELNTKWDPSVPPQNDPEWTLKFEKAINRLINILVRLLRKYKSQSRFKQIIIWVSVITITYLWYLWIS